MNNSQCLLELHGNDKYSSGNSVDIYTLNGEIEILNHNQSVNDVHLFCGEQYSSNCEENIARKTTPSPIHLLFIAKP